MAKRWISFLALCAILLSLCACTASGSFEKVLTTGSWTSDGDGEVCVRFYEDGTGIQYRIYDGEADRTSYLRWELSGQTLRILLTDRLDEDFAEYEDYVEAFKIMKYSKYIITLEDEDGRTYQLRRTSLSD